MDYPPQPHKQLYGFGWDLPVTYQDLTESLPAHLAAVHLAHGIYNVHVYTPQVQYFH